MKGNKKFLIGLPAALLAVSLIFIGCKSKDSSSDYSAELHVRNDSGVTQYVSDSTDKYGDVTDWYTLSAGSDTFYTANWDKGGSASITVYWQSNGTDAKSGYSQTYYFSGDDETAKYMTIDY